MTIQDQNNIQTQLQSAVANAPATDPLEAAPITCSSVRSETASKGINANNFTSNSIYQERLRQARAAFNLAFGLTAASAIISFAGVLLLFSGSVSAGAVTTAGGVASGAISASWLKLAKDANDRLDRTASMLEDES